MDTPPLQIAQEHKGTLIRCQVDGDPVPQISWYFHGVPVNGKLTSQHSLPHSLANSVDPQELPLSLSSDQQKVQRNRGRTETAERVAE